MNSNNDKSFNQPIATPSPMGDRSDVQVGQDELVGKEVDQSHLGDLYPRAKTFEERREEDKRREEARKNRLPKLPYISIALFGSFVFTAFTFFILNISEMWKNGSIAAIFFSFALWLALCGLAIWWVKYTNGIFYAYGRSSRFFWLSYGAVLSLLVAALIGGSRAGVAVPYLVLSLGAVHLLVLFLYLLIRARFTKF